MDNAVAIELAKQLSIRNQIDILKSLFKIQYIEGEEFTDRMCNLYDEIRN